MNLDNIHLTTFIFYMGIAIVSALGIYFAEKNTYVKIIDNTQLKKYYPVGKILYLILFISLVFISSFRYVGPGIGGADTLWYISLFQNNTDVGFNIEKIITLKQQEPLFYLLIKLVRVFTDNYLIFFIIIYSIITIGYLEFFARNLRKGMVIYPVILFVVNYIYSFSAIRVSLALPISFLAVGMYDKGSKKNAVILTLIAVLFHYSALVILMFFVFYEVYKSKIFRRKWIIVGTLIIASLSISLLINNISFIFEATKYRYYLDNQNNLRGQLPTIFFAFIVILNHKSLVTVMKEKAIFLYTVYFSFLLVPAVMFLGAYRLHSYFDFPKIIVMSYLIAVLKTKFASSDRAGRLLIDFIAFTMIVVWTSYLVIRTSNSALLMPYINRLFM